MTKLQAQLNGMKTQQGVLFCDQLVVKKKVGVNVNFLPRLERIQKFGSGDMPFSVRRGAYRSIIL